MKIKFEGEFEELYTGIGILSREYGFTVSEDGFPVKIIRRPGDINITVRKDMGIIQYERKIHFFRALGLLLETLGCCSESEISEKPQFNAVGAMFDVSRNAVMTVDTIQSILRKMAVMGLDMMMLYTEDAYIVEDNPYFGYMRGKYTADELKQCDDYADILGIEMIPCIQTLGHMEQFLKWPAAAHLRDTPDILLADNDEVYELIEKMIGAAAEPFRSRRIHIGMDEATGLGLGRYLRIHGYQSGYDIINRHLKKVMEITSRYGLKPMIWSDMYFRAGSENGDYYDLDAKVPDYVKEDIPDDVQLVYWDYYHDKEDIYRAFIQKHKRLGKVPVFAGGIWNWISMGTHYAKTFSSSNAALTACKKEGVGEVFAAIWNDDGAENSFFNALLGLQLFAEHGYSEKPDMEKLKRRVKFCTGIDFEKYMDLQYLDCIPGMNSNTLEPPNPSRCLLWQDVLMGLYDKQVEELNAAAHYSYYMKRFKEYCNDNREQESIFQVPHYLCSVLELKSEIGLRIKAAYDQDNVAVLQQIEQDDLPQLYQRVAKLRRVHKKQWFKLYKPFGWEVLDLRYGGLLARIDTARERIGEYLRGTVGVVEELEEERLLFDGLQQPIKCKKYRQIATASFPLR